MIQQTFKQLNTHYNRRTNTTGPPLAVHRVKVTFKDEPGEGSGVARSFYTAYAQAVLSCEKMPSLDGVMVGSKNLQYSEYSDLGNLSKAFITFISEISVCFKTR